MDSIRGGEQGYIPLKFFTDFLKFLYQKRHIIEVITYNDLDWWDDFDHEKSYPTEWENWNTQLKLGTRDLRKIYVLLQHDVDFSPERTMAILREEERLGIRSNVMLFRRRVNRRHFQKTGELLYTEYDFDMQELSRLQEKGFVFGYHCNAFERALFNLDKAMEIFEEDVNALRQHLEIRYFSPHGGARSADGRTNNSLPVPESLRKSIRWVANRRSVRFTASFSDGGPNSQKRDPSKRDLRDFVRSWKSGNRYRVLTHPQYYHSPCGVSPRLAEAAWYNEVLEFYSMKRPGSVWDEVTLLKHRRKSTPLLRAIGRIVT
jgi:hypothetical protein